MPTTRPGKLAHLEVDVPNKRVRMECQAVNAPAPLEYFLCTAGGAEHETVLRTHATPSNLHLALLLIGLDPGHPAQPIAAGAKRMLRPPDGMRVRLTCEFVRDGKMVSTPAEQLMRRIKDKRPPGPVAWVFAGSQVMRDGRYAADVTGQLITVVNFPFSLIDVAELRSSANEALEWEVNPELAPQRDATVWLVIEPAAPVARK